MAITFVWDAAFEAAPGNDLARSLIDNEIRLIARGIRERMEDEHEWGFNTELDTGVHRAGYVTVMGKGNAAAMAAVTNMQQGSLYLMTDGADLQIHIYITGTGWVKLSSIDHLGLAGTTDDDHPLYLKRDGGVMEADLNMGGKLLQTDGAGEIYSGFTLFRHRAAAHATLGNIDAIVNGILTNVEVKIGQAEQSGNLNNNTYVMFTLPVNAFFPQVYVSGAYDKDIWFIPGDNGKELGVANKSGGNRTYRLRYEYVDT